MQLQITHIVSLIGNDPQMQTLLNGTLADNIITPEISDQMQRFPCITYGIVGGKARAVPSYAQDQTILFNIYSRTNKAHIENIYSRLYALLNLYYEANSGPRIVWSINTSEMDMNETDRQLYKKIVRFQIIGKNV